MDELRIENSGDLMRVLGRMEGKLDTALEGRKDHERRLRKLEMRQWWAHGFSAGIGAVVSAAGTLFFGAHR